MGAGEGGLYTAGGVAQSDADLKYQPLDIRNALPVNIYICMEYASYIESALPFGNRVEKRHIKEFHRHFWHIFNYVRNSVDINKLNPDLEDGIEEWFKLYVNHHNRTDVLLVGVELFLLLVKNMQEWGIGQLFEKGIEPPFMTDEISDIEMLIEEDDEEVVSNEEFYAVVEEGEILEAPVQRSTAKTQQRNYQAQQRADHSPQVPQFDYNHIEGEGQ